MTVAVPADMADWEVVDPLAFLVPDRSGCIIGMTVSVDGGELLTVGFESGR